MPKRTISSSSSRVPSTSALASCEIRSSPGSTPALADERAQVGVELVARALAVARHLGVAAQVEGAADQAGVPAPEALAVLGRQAEDRRHHPHRQLRREVAHEARLGPLEQADDEIVDDAFDHRLPALLDAGAAKRLDQQLALGVVLASVELDDGAAEQRLGLRGVASGREDRIRERGVDVVEAAQDPGLRRAMEVERVVVAHQAIRRVRVVGEGGREDVGHGVAAVAVAGSAPGAAM